MNEQFEQIAQQLTPEIYQNMRRAVELGRWPDGRKVTEAQRETCLHAIIAWESVHLPEEERTGYLPPKTKNKAADYEQPVNLRGAGENGDA